MDGCMSMKKNIVDGKKKKRKEKRNGRMHVHEKLDGHTKKKKNWTGACP